MELLIRGVPDAGRRAVHPRADAVDDDVTEPAQPGGKRVRVRVGAGRDRTGASGAALPLGVPCQSSTRIRLGGSLGGMGGTVRRQIVAIVAGLVVLAVSVGSVTLLWYLPVPRRWWSLVLMILAMCALPALSGLLVVRGARGLIGDRRRHRASAS